MPFDTDVSFCARLIFRDLLCSPAAEFTIPGLREMCAYFYCVILPDPFMPRSVGATWDGEQILISMKMDIRFYCEAVCHELVHALSDGPRWEPLNYEIDASGYDRLKFIEAVATRVGLMFRFITYGPTILND